MSKRVRIAEDKSTPGFSSIEATTVNGQQQVYTVEDAVNYMGFGPFQILLTLFTGMSWVSIKLNSKGGSLYRSMHVLCIDCWFNRSFVAVGIGSCTNMRLGPWNIPRSFANISNHFLNVLCHFHCTIVLYIVSYYLYMYIHVINCHCMPTLIYVLLYRLYFLVLSVVVQFGDLYQILLEGKEYKFPSISLLIVYHCQVLLVVTIWIIVFGLASAVAPNYSVFLLFRFLTGLGIGGSNQS